MGLETGTLISQLVSTNPLSGDDKRQGDDHFRLIKAVLQGTFPNASKAYRFPEVLAKTGNYTVLSTDENKLITADATAAGFTLTLPTLAAGDHGWRIRFAKIDATANAVVLAGTINGAVNYTLDRSFEVAWLEWTGTQWVSNKPDLPDAHRIVTKTANATLTTAEMKSLVLVTAGSNPVTIILPAATVGDWVYIKSLHATNDVVIDPPGAVTIDGAATLTLGNQYETVLLVSNGTNWFVAAADEGTEPVVTIPADGTSSVVNLKIDNTVGTENTKIDILADEALLVDTSGISKKHLAVSVVVDSTVTGANGCDVGTRAASTSYFLWLISNGTTIAGLISTSATAPTMPSGYTYKKRVGWNRTDASSNFNRVRQRRSRGQYVVSASTTTALPLLASGAAGNVNTPTWVAVSLVNFIPSTATALYAALGVQASGQAIVAPNNLYGGIESNTNAPPFGVNSAAGGIPTMGSLLLESTSIYWASAGAANRLRVLGWEDDI